MGANCTSGEQGIFTQIFGIETGEEDTSLLKFKTVYTYVEGKKKREKKRYNYIQT
jgi:hypothetical protein